MGDRPWSDTDRELVRGVLAATLSGSTAQVDAVLDALTAAGWRRETETGEQIAAAIETRARTSYQTRGPAYREAAAIARAHRTTGGDHA